MFARSFMDFGASVMKVPPGLEPGLDTFFLIRFSKNEALDFTEA